ncbi:hypothetical protein Bpfe_001455 [Biomphalaria pfeifferi]|uniref:Uncharacterized protein n=1 Tax=Biomphalaria pfeifferi TaxID=112525 RepID=A0AAD8FME7_BIOPF|nr:hypothetical protein Bpfe_001455 [Biomphalaria pfeifferi]
MHTNSKPLVIRKVLLVPPLSTMVSAPENRNRWEWDAGHDLLLVLRIRWLKSVTWKCCRHDRARSSSVR